MPLSHFRTLDVEPANLVGMTAAHNLIRANVSPIATPSLPAMTWIRTIATDAQNYANLCTFAHGGTGLGTIYGQNIYAAAGFAATPTDIVGASWAGESVNYNYATNTCAAGKVCGHYTQVVWAASTRLGCGTKVCSTNSPFGSSYPNWQLWVCNYNTPGNYVGQKPYVSNGAPSTIAPTPSPTLPGSNPVTNNNASVSSAGTSDTSILIGLLFFFLILISLIATAYMYRAYIIKRSHEILLYYNAIEKACHMPEKESGSASLKNIYPVTPTTTYSQKRTRSESILPEAVAINIATNTTTNTATPSLTNPKYSNSNNPYIQHLNNTRSNGTSSSSSSSSSSPPSKPPRTTTYIAHQV